MTAQERRPGISVDAGGGPVIDPTKNVLDLVHAESKYQDARRADAEKYNLGLQAAETRRINELALQKQTFDLELAKVLRANQDAASTLLATQLKEVKTDLSDRVSKLEQFRWEAGGKSSGMGFFGSILLGIVAGISTLVALATLAFNIWHH